MKKAISFLICFFVLHLSFGQTLGGFNVATNYGNNTRNLAFTNRIFNKSYISMPTSSSATNPGMITAEFLATLSNGTACGANCSSYLHKGLDQGVGGSTNVSLYSPISGIVKTAGDSYGTIAIYNSTLNCTFIFLHCSTIVVSINNTVSIGTYVGKSGSTGATAAHVHSELRSGLRYGGSCQCSSAINDGVFDPRIVTDLFPSTIQTPVLIAPANNAVLTSVPINFSWTSVSGADNYRIQISTSNSWTAANGFTNPNIFNQALGNTTSFSWTSPPASGTYYWCVRAGSTTGGGSSNFSSPRIITYSPTTCSAPTGISSSNITSNSARINWQLNSTNTNDITLDWSPNGSVWNTINLPASYYYHDLSNLSAGTTYYYRLKRNCTSGGSSSYSSTYTFTTSSASNLSVSPSSLSYSSASGAQTLNVSSNVSWSATSNSSWATLSPSSGSNNGTISVSCTANTSSSARSATVTVTGGGLVRTVNISQSGNTSSCNDPFETNNLLSSAYNIGTVGSWTSNQLCFTSNDNDYFRFTAGGQTYYTLVRGYNSSTVGTYGLTISVSGNILSLTTFSTNGSTTDTWMELYNINQILITSSDDFNGTNFSNINYQLPSSIVSGGIYKLTRQGTSKVLDAAGCGSTAGTNVQLWDDLNNVCQRWVFELQSDGSYEIKRKDTNLNLDAQDCGNWAGANVHLWTDNNYNCQRWIVTLQQDGSYELMRQGTNGLNLDAQDCGNWAGANVHLWTDNNYNCQRWILTLMGNNADDTGLDDRSIEEPLEDIVESFDIYPNPASDQFSIRYTSPEIGDFVVNIFDLSGKLIESNTFDNTSSGEVQEVSLSVSGYSDGIYLVYIRTPNGQFTRKLSVKR